MSLGLPLLKRLFSAARSSQALIVLGQSRRVWGFLSDTLEGVKSFRLDEPRSIYHLPRALQDDLDQPSLGWMSLRESMWYSSPGSRHSKGLRDWAMFLGLIQGSKFMVFPTLSEFYNLDFRDGVC